MGPFNEIHFVPLLFFFHSCLFSHFTYMILNLVDKILKY